MLTKISAYRGGGGSGSRFLGPLLNPRDRSAGTRGDPGTREDPPPPGYTRGGGRTGFTHDVPDRARFPGPTPLTPLAHADLSYSNPVDIHLWGEKQFRFFSRFANAKKKCLASFFFREIPRSEIRILGLKFRENVRPGWYGVPNHGLPNYGVPTWRSAEKLLAISFRVHVKLRKVCVPRPSSRRVGVIVPLKTI